MAKKNVANVAGVKTKTTWKQAFKRDWQLYLLLLFPLIMVFVFSYGAYPGLRMAFMDYKPAKGYAGSEWVGMKTFIKIFKDADFIRALRNSVVFNLADLLIGFPMPIILALILNELRYPRFKKVSQTILYLPHFLSWVIIGGLVSTLFATNSGLINNGLAALGLKRVPWLSDNSWWIVMYVLVSVWQSIGYGAIVYMSAISGIDQEIYEAARVDGCSRFKMMYLITLPSIRTTIVIMLILKIGGMMSIGFEQPQMLKNAMVNDVGDVISTFIYRYGIQNAKHSISTAAGLLQSVINFALVITANGVSRKISDESIW